MYGYTTVLDIPLHYIMSIHKKYLANEKTPTYFMYFVLNMIYFKKHSAVFTAFYHACLNTSTEDVISLEQLVT